jgi:hypothetical protein
MVLAKGLRDGGYNPPHPPKGKGEKAADGIPTSRLQGPYANLHICVRRQAVEVAGAGVAVRMHTSHRKCICVVLCSCSY